MEIHTSIEGRVFLVAADTEELLNSWMDAINTTWSLHMLKYVGSS